VKSRSNGRDLLGRKATFEVGDLEGCVSVDLQRLKSCLRLEISWGTRGCSRSLKCGSAHGCGNII
jgi:hypothetical protein